MNAQKVRKVQKLWMSLSTSRTKRKWGRVGISRNSRRRRMWGFKSASSKGPDQVKLEVISAVTGDKTHAFAAEESAGKLKKWLKLRNMRAQFSDFFIPKNSSWSKLTEEGWKEHPVIVKIGKYEAPYVIDRIGDKITVNDRTTCRLFLKTVDNVNYLLTIGIKKKMMKELIKVVQDDLKEVIKSKRKKKRKKTIIEYDDI